MALPLALNRHEIGVLARAVSRAPSVHNTQPWELVLRDTAVDLLQRKPATLRIHDPEGRDRLLSCGAASADLRLAVRSLGRAATLDFADAGDVVATVAIGDRARAVRAELALYHAIGRRRSYRRQFSPDTVPSRLRAAVAAAGTQHGVRVGEPRDIEAFAGMLGHATLAFRQDHAYQRELAVWTAHTFGRHALGASDGIPEDALSAEALPVAGLIRGDTPVPDDSVLAARLRAESLIFLCTATDTRRDHLSAGYALQLAWLTATSEGLAGSVITQPLHLAGFRERLAERLELPGLPQAIFRFGHPAGPSPPSPRSPLGELFPDKPLGGT